MRENPNSSSNPLHDRPQRIEWWGGSEDVTKVGLLRPLLGQEVVRLEHAIIEEWETWQGQDVQYLTPENVVFTLRDGRRWELLDAQESDMRVLVFKEVVHDTELVTAGDLQREPGEQLQTISLQGRHPPLPWIVVGITEIWWNAQENPPHLYALMLWGAPQSLGEAAHSDRFRFTPLLAIKRVGDDFWMPTAEEVLAAAEDDLFTLENMYFHFYDLWGR